MNDHLKHLADETSTEPFHTLTVGDLLNRLQTLPTGLTQQEAESRLQSYGPNEIKIHRRISPLKIFLSQFHSFIVYILLSALAISYLLGENVDAIVIGIIIILNSIFGFIQEYKAEKSIEALKKLASPRANVIRDRKEQNISAHKLVPGDILKLHTGDRVPADARLIEVSSLQTLEATLTGESVPVSKQLAPLPSRTLLADRSNMTFAGTTVASGKGVAVVTRTGLKTQIGEIASLIQEKEKDETPLQKRLDRLGRGLGIVTIVICTTVFIAKVLTDASLEQDAIVEFFVVAVSLAVAAIPEGLPAVVTISLAIGVQRMIQRNALIRRLPSVETLGSTTVICTDKTGTLTQNEMTVIRIYANGKIIHVTGTGYNSQGDFLFNNFPINPESFEILLQAGVLNNDAGFDNSQVMGDPTEAALLVSAGKAGILKDDIIKAWPKKNEIPFSSERKRMTTIHTFQEKDHAFMKGAPEVVLNLCRFMKVGDQTIELTDEDRKEILSVNKTLADDALRVLGFAYKEVTSLSHAEVDLTFIGLQAMIDPPRVGVKESIQKCQRAGIRVVMITGDHQITAGAIARSIGIEGKTVTGKELEEMKDLDQQVETISIYARVNPEHKVKIVRALRKKGHIVAMTGDGVNDAPALKEADIGIAMGLSGTDVAKEASDMILTDDNFSSIVNAVEEGRGIYENIKKFIAYLLSSNLGEVLTIFMAIMIGLPLPLIAIMILWINLVTDGLPALALSVDPIDPHIMERQPANPNQSILSHSMITMIVLVSLVMMAGTLGLFFWFLGQHDLIYAQTVAFSTLMLFQMFNVINCRSEQHSIFIIGLFSNSKLLYAIMISIAMHLIVIYSPLSIYFKTVPLSLADWVFVILTASLVLIVVEIYKAFKPKF